MTATDVKAKILAILDEVAAGDEVIVTKHGRPVARLVPASGPQGLKGRFDGVVATVNEGDDLLSTNLEWDLS